MKRPLDESSEYFFWVDILIWKVIDLDAMITVDELMDLHRLERILLGRKGEKSNDWTF